MNYFHATTWLIIVCSFAFVSQFLQFAGQFTQIGVIVWELNADTETSQYKMKESHPAIGSIWNHKYWCLLYKYLLTICESIFERNSLIHPSKRTPKVKYDRYMSWWLTKKSTEKKQSKQDWVDQSGDAISLSPVDRWNKVTLNLRQKGDRFHVVCQRTLASIDRQ